MGIAIVTSLACLSLLVPVALLLALALREERAFGALAAGHGPAELIAARVIAEGSPPLSPGTSGWWQLEQRRVLEAPDGWGALSFLPCCRRTLEVREQAWSSAGQITARSGDRRIVIDPAIATAATERTRFQRLDPRRPDLGPDLPAGLDDATRVDISREREADERRLAGRWPRHWVRGHLLREHSLADGQVITICGELRAEGGSERLVRAGDHPPLALGTPEEVARRLRARRLRLSYVALGIVVAGVDALLLATLL